MSKTTTKVEPLKVRVNSGSIGYDILIGDGLLDQAGKLIAALKPRAKAAIVTDDNVDQLYGERCERVLNASGIGTRRIVVRPGEPSKSFSTYERVINSILDFQVDRKDLVIALGGGVVGDLAGFAAATVLRGIDIVQIPTTLLGQVDSSVGGKTGIDTKHGKNLVGAFHQPALVITDTTLISTLPGREFRSGYAEIAKYGLISDMSFFNWLEKNRVEVAGEALRNAVGTSCRWKAEIVARDEREAGERALLNLGHTFGHAFEAGMGYSDRLLHGEAISIGMALAFDLSAKLGLCPRADAERVRRHLSEAELPTGLAKIEGLPPTEKLLELMMQDKKVEHGSLILILVRGIGKAFIARDIDINAVREVLDEARRNT